LGCWDKATFEDGLFAASVDDVVVAGCLKAGCVPCFEWIETKSMIVTFSTAKNKNLRFLNVLFSL